jgi:hypothetical protein
MKFLHNLINRCSSVDHSARKLGKAKAKRDIRNLCLAKYRLPLGLPPIPNTIDWTTPVMKQGGYGMMKNDEVGDCLGAGTRLLTADLRWVPVEQIKVGDALIGFDEEPISTFRMYRKTIVEKVGILRKECFELQFADGTQIVASHDHGWLRKKRAGGQWLKTSEMVLGPTKSTQVGRCFPVWEEDTTYEAGYLAGMFDGEGCLGKSTKDGYVKQLRLAQRSNAALTAVRACLDFKGYKYTMWHHKSSPLSDNGYETMRLKGGLKMILKFLGSIRPKRLLAKFSPDHIGQLKVEKLKLIRKTPVGLRDVYAIQTSTKTFIAEGIASHNCAFASAGHLIQSWTANAGAMVVPPDADILAAYSAATGYNPADPSTDNGTVLLDALKFWQSVGISGHRIGAFVEVNPQDQDEVRAAMYLFGGIYAGVALPLSAQNQKIWDIDHSSKGRPNSWGGHAIPIVANTHPLLIMDRVQCVTWGDLKDMTWPFIHTYADELYAVVSQDWISGTQRSPSGLDMPTLIADLAKL